MTDTMTAQEVFDTVAKHLLAQGARASADNGECLYRGPNGTKCAVGCLLADEEYNSDMEGNSVWGIELPERLKVHAGLLSDLQALHDGSSPETWKAELAHFAKVEGLSCAVLN